MVTFDSLSQRLSKEQHTFLVTGAAGFIGSHLTQSLLSLNQKVVGLDNFSTGYQHNLDAAQEAVGATNWKNFRFIKGDVSDTQIVGKAVKGVNFILHQAALASVPRSIKNPAASHLANVDGFLTILEAARAEGVKRVVFASSSSVYGDSTKLPKVETETGKCLSPYALNKSINEQYAILWKEVYGVQSIGLRYFNVFGPRQDPNGAYAAVIPKWIDNARKQIACTINGDGETSRDFCFIKNVVQANLLSAFAPDQASGQMYNVAVGERATLRILHDLIWDALVERKLIKEKIAPIVAPFREGDVRHSLADITKAREHLGYSPSITLIEGMKQLVAALN